MGLFRWVSNERSRQILSHAEPHLEKGEEVTHWVRAQEAEGRRRAFVFLTARRMIVHWMGQGDGHRAVEWKRMKSWGVDSEAEGGPILGIEDEEEQQFVQIPVPTKPGAERTATFLRRFAELAPRPKRALQKSGHEGKFQPKADKEFMRQGRSLAGHTKRVLITILGLVLMVVGVLLTPVPGPWSFPIIIAGLAVLASEYDWAEDTLDWVKARAKATAKRFKKRKRATDV